MFIKITEQDSNTIIYYKLRDYSKLRKINNINNAKYYNTIQ